MCSAGIRFYLSCDILAVFGRYFVKRGSLIQLANCSVFFFKSRVILFFGAPVLGGCLAEMLMVHWLLSGGFSTRAFDQEPNTTLISMVLGSMLLGF